VVINRFSNFKSFFALISIILFFHTNSFFAQNQDWQTEKVNLRLGNGAEIKAINHPAQHPVPLKQKSKGRLLKPMAKKPLPAAAKERLKSFAKTYAAAKTTATVTTGTVTKMDVTPVFASVIDSPPLDGFVPYIAVTATDDGLDPFSGDYVAYETSFFTENYLPANPQGNFVLGLFDTGASAHVMGYNNSVIQGIAGDYLTQNIITISGVDGSVDAYVSMPIGIFIDGLGAIGPGGDITDTTGMVGQTNVAIAVGMNNYPLPDLATAIGSPLAVYFTTVLYNDNPVTVTYDANLYTAPDIHFYEYDDPCIPDYPYIIPLELRPLGAVNVQYIPNISDIFSQDFGLPGSPSVIVGNFSQSLFFVSSVDLYDNNKSAIDKNRFMLDTGAQVTVIGSRIAARLGLDPRYPEFTVDIEGITGEVTTLPGFYLDKIELPALGRWLSFTDIPVVLLDVSSPEGGTLDGIIGMNLFVNFNLVLEGGGFFAQPDPVLKFYPARLLADIAPAGGDGIVDFLDLQTLLQAWLATPTSPNWNPNCDIAPYPVPDGKIDFLDFAMLANFWLWSNDF
jgi:hypothetical protein